MKLSHLLYCTVIALGTCYAEPLPVQHLARDQHFIHHKGQEQYILLPVQNSAPEVPVEIIANNALHCPHLKIRLARDHVDYYVPLDLDRLQLRGKKFVLSIYNTPANALCWSEIKSSDQFNLRAEEPYRPVYHHTPPYGWMNDPNGMFYQDGVYHLYYQFNPYGTLWGNMHWGHSSTTDFINWKDEPVAIAPDVIGTIFSGCAIVDHKNAAGFGKDTIIAYYTSAANLNQVQSIAYSTDKGQTFTKYEGNPILSSNQVNFRDPKVIYDEASQKYIMVLAVERNIEFYSSTNLLDWKFESKFGAAYDPQGVIRECPDFFPLTKADGSKKWVLFMNNGGGPAGGGATQYFIGDFDGSNFTCDVPPPGLKWQDWGKNHYATVTWSNAPDGRVISIAWMNDWQHGHNMPTTTFRSINSIPRELYLFKHAGEDYLGSRPVAELKQARKEVQHLTPAAEICFTLQPKGDSTSFYLENKEGQRQLFTVDTKAQTLISDGRQADITSNAVSKVPIMGQGYTFRIFLDKSSIECFMNDGRSVLSNCIFPASPFTKIIFDEATTEIRDLKMYEIQTKTNASK